MTTSIAGQSIAGQSVRYDDEYGVYFVDGYDEVSAVLRGSGWSSDPRRNPLAPAEIRDLPQTALIFMDPPDHTRLRRIVGPVFTPRSIERIRPRVASIVEAALDGLDESAELVSEFAYVVPLAVIAELLDVGAEGAELFADLTPDLVKMLELDATPEDLVASVDASVELMLELTPILADRKQHPGDDFISALLAQDGITVDEVLGTCLLLLAAGHETTANLIANGTRALVQNPAHVRQLAHDPVNAVEELLRVEGPVKMAGRTALEDVELGGVTIPAGSFVLLQLDRANVDPRRFDDPLRLDLGRKSHGHLAFGSGPHFCLGAALSRMETAEALTRLFARHPDLELADEEPSWRVSNTFRALTELHVRALRAS
ncbi:cytochrome P450 [Antrihabitans sp. YC3-6]|uniref:Cytochrome P450 n=1 Tax=Antrihabitans stalagmiti TaxID=2799499 RepID=A0A934NN63_9NOCA|nr:cytochrome P450 [Antrihabitans stalagmiti]MBJ8338269.1 cytochrome P450 [Antrihabitans stalagmiti]